MTLSHCDTPLLRMAYLAGGREGGVAVILLHGWPDDPTTYDGIAPALWKAGFRTVAPWLRGFGPTRFLNDDTFRSGEIAAMARDILDLADALGLARFVVVGHDWGARIAYLLASVCPERIICCMALSLLWRPGPPTTPSFEQSKAFWYQWFMATERGAAIVREQGKDFARFQWLTWSPSAWYDEDRFQAVAKSFDNPDWAAVTLHSYRVRWGEAEPDPRYADLARRQIEAKTISVPTLIVMGADDRCVPPQLNENEFHHFTNYSETRILPGTGHFPTREAPAEVTDILIPFLRTFAKTR